MKIQEDIKSKKKELNIGNIIKWIEINESLPPENCFVLVIQKGFLPYSAILEEGKWYCYEQSPDDKTEIYPTHWTEFHQP